MSQQALSLGGPFHDAPYPALSPADFASGTRYQVTLRNGARSVLIGDVNDAAIQHAASMIQPGPGAVDVIIHGLPGRFIEKFGGSREIPPDLVETLLQSVGIQPGTPLRLLTCHAAELPLVGPTAAQQLANRWGGIVSGPNGLLHIYRGWMRIDLVDWIADPIFGGMMIDPSTIRVGAGTFVP
jgi:hypothetical protein